MKRKEVIYTAVFAAFILLLILHSLFFKKLNSALVNANAARDTTNLEENVNYPKYIMASEVELKLGDKKMFLPLDREDPEVKFQEHCKYWIDMVKKWKVKIDENDPEKNPLTAIQERSGAGDRLSGLITALNHAMQRGRRLNFFWAELDGVFNASNKTAEIVGTNLVELHGGKAPELPYRACKQRAYYACDFKIHQADKCPVYNRACMNQRACRIMREIYQSDMTQINVFGCPLRMLVKPNEEVKNMPLTWFMDGILHNGTLRDVEGVFKKFEMISIHLRVGDHTFHGISTFRLKPIIDDVRSCAGSVDKLIEMSNRGQEVRWFVASDNPTIRRILREKFGDKVIMLMHRPRHLDTINRIKSDQNERLEIQNMFAEWYLLGKGDHLIVNAAHEKGRGVSSFSRTAWLYTLRSQHYLLRNYDGTFCRRQEFQYEGNLNIPNICRVENPLIPQPHLSLVKQKTK